MKNFGRITTTPPPDTGFGTDDEEDNSKFGQITTPLPDIGFGTDDDLFSLFPQRNTICLEVKMVSLIRCEAKNTTPGADKDTWEMKVYSEKGLGVTNELKVRAWYGTDSGAKNYHSGDGKFTDWCCQTKCDDKQLTGGQPVFGVGGANEWKASILAKFVDVNFYTEGITKAMVSKWQGYEEVIVKSFSVTKKFKPGHCPTKYDAIAMMQEAKPRPIASWFWHFGDVKKWYAGFGEAMFCPPDGDVKVVSRTLADAIYAKLDDTPLGDFLKFIRPITDQELPFPLNHNPESILISVAKSAAPEVFLALKIFETVEDFFSDTEFTIECDPWCKCDDTGIVYCWKCVKKGVVDARGSSEKYECVQGSQQVNGYCVTGEFETKELCEENLKAYGCSDN